MSLIKICATLLVLQLAQCEESIAEPPKLDPGYTHPQARIVGGALAPNRSHFAYKAALFLDDIPRCGASIIDHRNLLTAAQCVSDQAGIALQPARLTALLGALTVDEDVPEGAVTRQIRQIFVHERFNPTNLMNDIAVLRIDVLEFNQNITSVPISRWTPLPSSNCTITGWGATSIGGIPSRSLRYAVVQIQLPLTCSLYFGSLFLQGMLCAGYAGRDVCLGDEGGPLVCEDVQVGIISRGFGCGDMNYPSIYTSIPNYFTWIQIQQETLSGAAIQYRYTTILIVLAYLVGTKIV